MYIYILGYVAIYIYVVKQIKVCMFKRRQGVAVLEAHTHMIYKDKDMVCIYIYIYIYMREWEVSIKTDVWVLLQNTGVNMKRSTWKSPRGKHENQHGLNIKLTTGNKGYMWRVTTHNETHTHTHTLAAMCCYKSLQEQHAGFITVCTLCNSQHIQNT